jgi:hypothetical protein
MNFRPFNPNRSCLKKTGPSDEVLMAMAVIMKNGKKRINPIDAAI